MKRILAIVLVVMLAVSLMATAEAADANVLKISTSGTAEDIMSKYLQDCAKAIEERTNGQVKFELYYNNELGSLADVTEQITMGGNIVNNASGDFYAPYGCEDIMACALFYVFPNYESVGVFSDSELFQSWCDQIAENSGIRILCCNWAGSPRSIISTKPINSAEDIKNLKIRVPGLAADSFFTALGASTMSMPFPDIYTSMQQGMLEAAEAPLDILYNYSLQEVAKYVYLSEHSMAPACFGLSEQIWKSISPENQKIVKDTFIEFGTAFSAAAYEGQNEYMDMMKEAGVTFTQPSDADKEVLKAAGAASFDAFPNMKPGLAEEIAAIIG